MFNTCQRGVLYFGYRVPGCRFEPNLALFLACKWRPGQRLDGGGRRNFIGNHDDFRWKSDVKRYVEYSVKRETHPFATLPEWFTGNNNNVVSRHRDASPRRGIGKLNAPAYNDNNEHMTGKYKSLNFYIKHRFFRFVSPPPRFLKTN